VVAERAGIDMQQFHDVFPWNVGWAGDLETIKLTQSLD
jgi:hypothetical protein